MPAPRQITYLTRKEIDTVKWDNCIDTAGNGLIYAYSFYLDTMAENWDALVCESENKYATVMPLTWKKKYGISYLYQPAFTASLGVFSEKTDKELVEQFIKSIPSKFRLIEIDLNTSNYFEDSGIQFFLRKNYVLNLNFSFDSLYSQYRENHKRNISKAQQLGCIVKTGIPVEEIIRLSHEFMKNVSHLTRKEYDRFTKLYTLLQEKGETETYGIYKENDELMASAVFFFSHHRAYYILVGNHPDGRTIGASHALINAFIKNHAGENLQLDFEGSDIRNLAHFYFGFGANEEIYPALRINRLPWYIRWMKK